MNSAAYYIAKHTAANLGIDAYQNAHSGMNPEKLQALRDLSIEARCWGDFADGLVYGHKKTLLECLQDYESSKQIKTAAVVLRSPEGEFVGKFDGPISVLLRLLAFEILRMEISLCAVDEDDGRIRVFITLKEE